MRFFDIQAIALLIYIQGSPPLLLDIESQCDSQWNSDVLSGKFHVAGGLGDHTLYVNDLPDGNGNNWYLWFDNNKKMWRFWYGGIPQPGDNIWGYIVSEYDSTLIGKNEFLGEFFDEFVRRRMFLHRS